MLSLKTPIKFLEAVFLDLVALPTIFMSKKGNAKWHLIYMCPLCSDWRKSFRDFNRKNKCLWCRVWKKEKYKFSRNFGFLNWLRYYFGMETNLKKYEKEYKHLVLS